MQKFMVRKSIIIIYTVIMAVFFWGNTIIASENYELVSEWGGHGSGEGQFDDPWDIAIDGEDNIYVVDQENCRIQKFTSEGEYITAWGSCESGTGNLFNPTDVATDHNGNVYVLNFYYSIDDNGHTQYFRNIQKFTADGEFITKWGSYGTEDGQFIIPMGIATDSEGNVFVADWDYNLLTTINTSRIQKFTSEGEFILKWGSSGTILTSQFVAFGLTIDDEDNIYIVSLAFPVSVLKFSKEGEYIAEWSYYNLSDGFLPIPNDITTDSEGNVYIAMQSTNVVKKFTSDGESLANWTLTTSEDKFSLGNPRAYGIALDSKGNVYVNIPSNNVVQKYAKNGQVEQPCPIEALYGEHAEKTELLRHFRDNILSQTPEGQELIKLYYEWGPVIVKAMEKDEKFKESVKGVVEGFLSLITGGA